MCVLFLLVWSLCILKKPLFLEQSYVLKNGSEFSFVPPSQRHSFPFIYIALWYIIIEPVLIHYYLKPVVYIGFTLYIVLWVLTRFMAHIQHSQFHIE